MACVNGVCLSCGQDGRTPLELLSNAADAARLQVHCFLTTHKFLPYRNAGAGGCDTSFTEVICPDISYANCAVIWVVIYFTV
jgi:hypothetical protein